LVRWRANTNLLPLSKAGWKNPPMLNFLVSNVAPGSIDISFIPDSIGMAATLFPLIASRLELLEKFAKHLLWLLDLFSGGDKPDGAIPGVHERYVAVRWWAACRSPASPS
jgi:hypothetical protein